MSDPSIAYSQLNSQVPSEGTRAPSTSPARSSVGTAFSIPSPVRFYRPDEQSQLSFRDSSPDSDSGLFPLGETFLEHQETALSHFASLHEWIAILEVTRLTKTRMGAPVWIRSWQQSFRPEHVRALGAITMNGIRKIDTLFTAVAEDVHQLLSRYQQEVLHAVSKEQIDRILARMKAEVPRRRDRRRQRAQRIFDRMRRRIQERLPLFIRDEVMDQMKRTLFALDRNCDYDEVPVSELEQLVRDHWRTPESIARNPGPHPTLHVQRDPNMRATEQQFVRFGGLEYPLPPGHRAVGYSFQWNRPAQYQQVPRDRQPLERET